MVSDTANNAGLIPFCLAMPPKYGHRRSLTSGLRIGTRSLVLKNAVDVQRVECVHQERNFLMNRAIIQQYICMLFRLLPLNIPISFRNSFSIVPLRDGIAFYRLPSPERLRGWATFVTSLRNAGYCLVYATRVIGCGNRNLVFRPKNDAIRSFQREKS
jgi:hypothetical protein